MEFEGWNGVESPPTGAEDAASADMDHMCPSLNEVIFFKVL